MLELLLQRVVICWFSLFSFTLKKFSVASLRKRKPEAFWEKKHKLKMQKMKCNTKNSFHIYIFQIIKKPCNEYSFENKMPKRIF